MKKICHAFLVSLIFSAFVGMCTMAMAQEAAKPKENTTITTRDGAPPDREIDIRIEEIFDEIDGLENVNASVRSGVVTLRGTVNEATTAERALELANRIEGVVAVESEIVEVTEVSERLVPVISRFEKRLKQALDYLPLFVLAAAFWMIVSALGWFISSRRRPWSWIAPNAFIADLMRQIVFLAFILLGLVMALDILGATAVLGTILGAAGIVGLAIGFAVRDTVENYIASILLSIRQPFRPMDLIGIDSYEGRVIRLTSRATILMDKDGNHIRIPNATVYKNNITNYTRNPERRFSFQLGIDADSDLQAALNICLAELEKMDFALSEPSPSALVSEVGDSNVLLDLAAWIDQTSTDFLKARSEAIRLTKSALETSGFALPEPIYRLKIDGATDFPKSKSDAGRREKKEAGTHGPARSAMIDTETQMANTTADQTVLKKVEEERRLNSDGEDLLNDAAEDELGPRTGS